MTYYIVPSGERDPDGRPVMIAAAENEAVVREALAACRDPAGVAVTVRVIDGGGPELLGSPPPKSLPSPPTASAEDGK